MDTRRPRMFSDEEPEEVLQKAKKLSDLKNLGPKAEASLIAAGINSVAQFKKQGWKKSMLKLVAYDKKNKHSMLAYALIGALTNKEWNAISEQEKQEARDFVRSIKI